MDPIPSWRFELRAAAWLGDGVRDTAPDAGPDAPEAGAAHAAAHVPLLRVWRRRSQSVPSGYQMRPRAGRVQRGVTAR